MKKVVALLSVIITVLNAFALPVQSDGTSVSDGTEEIVFHLSGESGDIVRSPEAAPFTCLAYFQTGLLLFYSDLIATGAIITIENMVTGDIQESSIVMGPVPVAVYLPTSGSISISVALQTGQHFVAFLSL